MAYTSCAAELAANIAKSCSDPNVGGYTGRAVFIPRALAPSLTLDSSNPRIVKAITLESGDKTIVLDNVMPTDPLTGSTTEMTTDNGWAKYNKSLAIRVPLRGGAVSKSIVEPLVNSPLGVIAIVEKKYAGGDGSFEIIGLEAGAKATAQTRNEYENGGDWACTLSAVEDFAEYTLFDTDYATTLAKFEALWALAV